MITETHKSLTGKLTLENIGKHKQKPSLQNYAIPTYSVKWNTYSAPAFSKWFNIEMWSLSAISYQRKKHRKCPNVLSFYQKPKYVSILMKHTNTELDWRPSIHSFILYYMNEFCAFSVTRATWFWVTLWIGVAKHCDIKHIQTYLLYNVHPLKWARIYVSSRFLEHKINWRQLSIHGDTGL